MSRPRATLPRRVVMGSLLALAARRLAFADDGAAAEPDVAQWRAFKARFVASDGRIVDSGNGGVSHSEGQGWGLLFAEYFDDPGGFGDILAWTAAHLRRPHDALHAWKYVPGASNPVSDLNNATDGDLYIAWALARAARRWGAPDYTQQASAIGQDVLAQLVARVGPQTLLLPGASGFANRTGVIVNPSYYVFAALTELGALCPSPVWAALRDDGLALLERAQFGAWKLPPDWLLVSRADGVLSPAPGWPPRCSFDAVRVPLQLAWAGLAKSAPVAAFAAFYSPQDGLPPPAWVDLSNGDTAPYAASPGAVAVVRGAAALAGVDSGPGAAPRVEDAPNYYSAALGLLAGMAFPTGRQG